LSRCNSILVVLAMALCTAFQPTCAWAAGRQYALLVGVSEYPALAPELQLHGGPRNDVLLFRDYLQAHGVAPSDITVLTEGDGGGTALPTRAAIMENLSLLAQEVHEGDFVILEFAGHGSQQPSKDDALLEPDGMDEIFLPRDVGHWDGVPGTVQNAVTDNEFGEALGRIRARGAFVWAVFDTCHSATMTRATRAADDQDREVTPMQLGIPAAAIAAARRQSAASARKVPPPRRPRSAREELFKGTDAGAGGYVVFYSAQRQEGAPQRLLPEHAARRELHGLFTYNLMQALWARPDATYRQIMERVLQQYQGLGIEMTTPGYEGTALDARVLGVTTQAPVVQWPLRSKEGQLTIEAGNLERVTQDSILAVVSEATSNDAAILGYVRVVSAGMAEAQVEPTAYAGKAAFHPSPDLVAAYARPIDLRMDFTLRVSLPAAGKYCEAPGETVSRTLEAIRTDKHFARRVEWVAADAPADVRLCKRSNRLLFLDGTGLVPVDPDHWGYGLRLQGSDARPTPGSTLSPFAAALLDGLERIARVTNLYRVAAAMPATDAALTVMLDYCAGSAREFEKCHPTPINTASDQVLHGGGIIRVRLINTSLHPVDVTVLHVDARYAVTPLFPDPEEPEEHARLPPRSKPIEFRISLTATPPGFERLLVIAVAAKPESEEMNFVNLAQAGLPSLGTRGNSTRLMQLLEEAAHGDGVRGDIKIADAGVTAAITTYSWTVKP